MYRADETGFHIVEQREEVGAVVMRERPVAKKIAVQQNFAPAVVTVRRQQPAQPAIIQVQPAQPIQVVQPAAPTVVRRVVQPVQPAAQSVPVIHQVVQPAVQPTVVKTVQPVAPPQPTVVHRTVGHAVQPTLVKQAQSVALPQPAVVRRVIPQRTVVLNERINQKKERQPLPKQARRKLIRVVKRPRKSEQPAAPVAKATTPDVKVQPQPTQFVPFTFGQHPLLQFPQQQQAVRLVSQAQQGGQFLPIGPFAAAQAQPVVQPFTILQQQVRVAKSAPESSSGSSGAAPTANVVRFDAPGVNYEY